ncbi:MAG: CoA transferase, subunit [Dehalococcoidales bacterium]|nr:CoA transferase, subunit [Dehalococcoidales bacterium]
MNKIFPSAAAALEGVGDGASIMFGGFGVVGFPFTLIQALQQKGTRNIVCIANSCGRVEKPGLDLLFKSRQVKKAIVSFPIYVEKTNAFEEQYLRGEIELELVPQGTLAERIRAGGAGIPAFYTPTGVGTIVEAGKEKKVFDGKPYLLERALRADFAFVRAYKADKMGNLIYRKSARNFNPMMAMAADVTIAEVEEIVEVGELDPDAVVTPGLFVDRIVRGEKHEIRFE